MKSIKILFICLGNICRSPSAEGILKKMVSEQGLNDRFYIDSAGTLSAHKGELPNDQMRTHARMRGYELTSRSRPIKYDDFFDFDLIIGMDDQNISDLQRRAPDSESKTKIQRMTDFCSKFNADHVPDPYYGGFEGFEYALDLIEDACLGIIEKYK